MCVFNLIKFIHLPVVLFLILTNTNKAACYTCHFTDECVSVCVRVLEVETRALCLSGKCYTSGLHSLPIFKKNWYKIMFSCPGCTWACHSPASTSQVVGIISMHHHCSPNDCTSAGALTQATESLFGNYLDAEVFLDVCLKF